MATKFIRKRRVDEAPDSRARLFARDSASRVVTRGRFSFFSIGLLAVVIFALAQMREAPSFRFLGQPVVRGDGIIVDKTTTETGGVVRFHLHIEAGTGEGGRLPGVAAVDGDQWERLAVGDRVTLLYQVNRQGTAVRIRQVGQVALPVPMQ
ncbi:MAG TPA: hypothetical protein PKI11_13550 [Candidatus Hydrogenedentes bacterium]|nr:hypothetical protein [Candidatus Hydrogenedentota bacterium]HNT87623.1 hypothetical protein [Candidatus Hydrogenedentota bacterium]